eukprot:686844-Hanusia_phi.AAC.1
MAAERKEKMMDGDEGQRVVKHGRRARQALSSDSDRRPGPVAGTKCRGQGGSPAAYYWARK